MRVGTISVNINTPDFNYGAILHSWAFQQHLKRLDFIESSEIIDYTTPYLENRHRLFPFIDVYKNKGLKAALRYIKSRYFLYFKRYLAFKIFTWKHLKVSFTKYTQKKLNNRSLPYDIIISESDVIWSPLLCQGSFDKVFFLALDSMKSQKKIAYSPSIGDGIPSSYTEEFSTLIKDYSHISCRESYAKPYIENLFKKPVEHVLDPVMLLDASDYDKITAPRISKDSYVLLYLPVNNNLKLQDAAKRYAKEKNLKLIEISTKLKNNEDLEVHTLTAASVEDFLSAIKYATSIFTNSFHAVCFSVIFKKDFYAFSRKFSGKVQNICDILDLSDRYFPSDDFIEKKPIDYSHVYEKWEQKKVSSKNWLKNALLK